MPSTVDLPRTPPAVLSAVQEFNDVVVVSKDTGMAGVCGVVVFLCAVGRSNTAGTPSGVDLAGLRMATISAEIKFEFLSSAT